MDPNQNTPANYLDQIAPTSQKKAFVTGNFRLLLIVSAVLVIGVIIAIISVNVYNSSRREPWNLLVARLDSTEKIATAAAQNIKSSQLRSLNSEVRLFLTNTKNDIKAPLEAMQIDQKKLPATIVKQESADPALARLETARLNAVYDRAYATEMKYQLSLLLSALQQAYQVSGKEETKQVLTNTYTSLQATHQSLSNYSAVNATN